MCGRFTLNTTNEELMRRFAVQTDQNYPNRWNIAPSQTSLTITRNNDAEIRLNTRDIFGVWQSGLGKRVINARSETIAEKSMFKEVFKHRRCLILASGWFEWDARKTPYFISLRDKRVMAFAGLRFKEGRDNSFVIVTSAAKGELLQLHHRTPLLLQQKFWPIWLGTSHQIPEECMASPESHFFNWHRVSSKVGNVANDNADLVLPVFDEQSKLLI